MPVRKTPLFMAITPCSSQVYWRLSAPSHVYNPPNVHPNSAHFNNLLHVRLPPLIEISPEVVNQMTLLGGQADEKRMNFFNNAIDADYVVLNLTAPEDTTVRVFITTIQSRFQNQYPPLPRDGLLHHDIYNDHDKFSLYNIRFRWQMPTNIANLNGIQHSENRYKFCVMLTKKPLYTLCPGKNVINEAEHCVNQSTTQVVIEKLKSRGALYATLFVRDSLSQKTSSLHPIEIKLPIDPVEEEIDVRRRFIRAQDESTVFHLYDGVVDEWIMPPIRHDVRNYNFYIPKMDKPAHVQVVVRVCAGSVEIRIDKAGKRIKTFSHVTAFQSRIKELEAENDHFQENTQTVIQQQREKLSQNEESIEAYKNEIEELQKKCDEISAELETYKEKGVDFSVQNGDVSEKTLLEKELTQKSKDLEKLQIRFDKLQQNQTKLQDSLKKVTSECEKFKKELLQSKIEKEELYAKYTAEEKEFKKLEEELLQKISELSTLKEESDKQLLAFQSRIKELEAENDHFQENTQTVIQQQREKLSQNEESIEAYKNEMTQLQKELTQKSEVLAKFKKRLLEDGQQLKNVQTELSHKTEELLMLKEQSNEQLLAFQSRIKELEAENDHFQEDTQTVIQQKREKEMNSVNAEELSSNIQALQQEVQRLNMELKTAYDSQNQLQRELSEKTVIINELHKQIGEMSSDSVNVAEL
uniref:Uncharacterized protein n=1 Tax=Panagrolaimus sp. ES5 TaxID=591445 RepID=A0AC34GRS8_9BILA